MVNRVIFIGILFIGLSSKVWAQGEATRVLNRAEDSFEQGNLSNIPSALEANRGKYFKKQKAGGFSKEESVRAYRLLTLVHLYNDNQPAAEEAFVNLLRADPEHPPTDSDPQEFHFLHEKFNTDPIFRIGIKFGAVRTEASPFVGFGSSDISTGGNKIYTAGISFMAETNFEYRLPLEGFELVSGITFSLDKFDIENSTVSSGDIGYQLSESQTWLKLPILLRYNFKLNKNLTPYIYGGLTVDYLMASTLSGSRSGGQPLTVSAVDLIANDLRSQLNQSVAGGIGLKLASKTNFIVIETRYSHGLTNVVNSTNRFAVQNLLFGASYVDDNFSQNSISFSIGYIKSFYKPKKLSEKKYNKKLQQKFKKEQK